MEKDTNQSEHPKKDIQVYEAVSSFIKDKDGVYLYRKSEKICKAYFLLTRHIADNESIKTKLRNSALELSSKTLEFVGSIDKSEHLSRQIVLEALSLVSMSDMAVISRLISESNYHVVVKQIELFIAEIEHYWKAMSYSSQAIPSTLFDIEAFTSLSSHSAIDTVLSEKKREDHMSFIKDNTSGSHAHDKKFTKPVRPASHASVAAPLAHSSTPSSNSGATVGSKVSGGSVVDGNKSERQTLIMNTIRAKGELSIKDLTDVIKGCSEKTIQRELIALVSNGALLKTGERRWSRYSVAK